MSESTQVAGAGYLSAGTVLAGRYAVGREIGRGGYSVVYAARDRKLDADVAVKHGEKGADVSAAVTTDELAKPVTVYQFTDSGVALSAVATGTKYYRDDDLN